MFWLFIAASVGVFTIYILVHLCCILKGRVLCIEYEQARISALTIFQDPEAARTTFREGNPSDLAFAGIAATLAAAAVTLASTVKIKRGLSTSLIISSAFACICLRLSVKYNNAATQFAVVPVHVNDPQGYAIGLLVNAFVSRKIGYRLLLLFLALAVGWSPAVGGPLMFAAVLILVVIFVIRDIWSHAAVSHPNQDTESDTFSEHSPQRENPTILPPQAQDTDQDTFSLRPLERENPTRLPPQAQQFRHSLSSLV